MSYRSYWPRLERKQNTIIYWERIALLRVELVGEKPANSVSPKKRKRLLKERREFSGCKRCEVCNEAVEHLHHRNYDRKETVYNVVLLCARCHQIVHKRKVLKSLADLPIKEPYQLSLFFDAPRKYSCFL